MSEKHKSSSEEQVIAEQYIFEAIEKRLQIKLEHNRKIYLADNPFTYMQPDFYSEELCIVGEIFSHIGKPKKDWKICLKNWQSLGMNLKMAWQNGRMKKPA